MLPILCYHKVGPVSIEGRWLNVEPKRLDSHVRFFVRNGYQFMRVEELAELFPNRAVCFTFDDAYHSALTLGLDVLRRHQVTGTFYAVPSLVGGSSSWDGSRAKLLARWELLQEAQRDGFEIGNHTWSHADLSTLSLAAQVAEWRNADEEFLRRGISAESYCYPYGRLNGESVDAARAAGAKVAVALAKRPATALDDRLRLPRIVIAYSDGLPKLLYKLHIRPKLKGG